MLTAPLTVSAPFATEIGIVCCILATGRTVVRFGVARVFCGMQWELPLFGVAVRIDKSWTATAAAFTIALAWCVILLEPEISVAGAFALGSAVVFALTVSLLLHELAHARASMSAGIDIDHIRIFGGGALCRRRGHVEHARDQFTVAVAGPVASVALGSVTLAVAIALELAGASSTLSVAFGFVAFANVLIAASNLLPMLPFDGGKVIHALFWSASGDRDVAAARTRRSGRDFARIVVSLGLLMVAWAGESLLGMSIAAFGCYLMFLPAP